MGTEISPLPPGANFALPYAILIGLEGSACWRVLKNLANVLFLPPYNLKQFEPDAVVHVLGKPNGRD